MNNTLKFSITFILSAIFFIGYSAPSINLIHLSKEEYTKQIEQCTDSAYTELGIKNPNAIYDENTYDWIVGVINNIIDKNFSSSITHNDDRKVDIYYKVIWHRNNKNLSFGLAFYNKGKKIGETLTLYGIMTENAVKGIVKMYNCKKEIKRILEGEIK